jgi:hypothetical protein
MSQGFAAGGAADFRKVPNAFEFVSPGFLLVLAEKTSVFSAIAMVFRRAGFQNVISRHPLQSQNKSSNIKTVSTNPERWRPAAVTASVYFLPMPRQPII